MASVPRALFLNRAYVSHEHQKRLCAWNDQRRVMGLLTGHLRNPAIHKQGRVRMTFLFRQYPSLQSVTELSSTLDAVRKLYEGEGYGVETECDSDGFSITLDWRVV